MAIATIPAVASVWLHPKRHEIVWQKPAVDEVSLAEIAHWPDVLWVDARPSSAYAVRHIPGAVPLNESEWPEQFPQFLQAWDPQKKVVVYCDSSACDASRAIATRLRHGANLENIYVLKGGWAAWLENQR